MVDTGGTRGCEREVGKAIGIDLGTTNSCTAIMEGGEPRILTHRSDTNLIPSVVALNSEENLVVGSEARELSRADPAACVTGAKRLIGRSFTSSTVERIREFCPYELVEGDQAQVKVRLHDKVLSVEEISAAILRKLVDLSEQDLGAEVTQAVITVPAYFNDRQRQAVRAAAELADIEVLRILNEPTAAALAYSLGKHLSRNIAVYDLGGGTFDVSVIQVQGSVLEVSATGGDTFLGGIDFDNRVIKHVLETFRDQNDIDLSNDAKALRRLAEACENAKVELSQEETTRIFLPGIAESADGPLDVDMSIDRATLEMLTEDLVQRTMDTTRRILDEAGLEPGQVDEIILVGGQTRMPHIIEALEGLTGRTPNRSINPQEAVAIGAAIMTHSMVGSSGQDLSLLDVLAMPIGINKVDGTMHVLFSKNQPLPSYKTRSLTTSKDDQTSIRIRLYQGESRTAEHNELLGTFVLHNLRPAPKGEVNVKIHFHVDSQGVLTLSGEDAETGESIDVRVKMGKPGDIKAVTRDHGKSDEDPSQQTTEEIKTDIPDDPEKRAGGMMSWFKKVLGGD